MCVLAALLLLNHYLFASNAASIRVRNSTAHPAHFRYRGSFLERGRITVAPGATVYPIVYRGEARAPGDLLVECEVALPGQRPRGRFTLGQLGSLPDGRPAELVISDAGFEVLAAEPARSCDIPP